MNAAGGGFPVGIALIVVLVVAIAVIGATVWYRRR